MLDGQGVGLFFCGLLEEDLESGLLHAPFAVRVDPGSAYYFVRPRGKPARRGLAQFERWLLQETLAGETKPATGAVKAGAQACAR